MLDILPGSPQRHDSLTIFPLATTHLQDLPYILLADALAAGALRITEVGSGTVPSLLARNDGAEDVLLLDGEQLVGARQNRMTNRTILLPGKTTTEIPVSCMERGRWHFRSDHFDPAPQHAPAQVRRRARDVEVRYAAAGRAPGPSALSEAQGEVWDQIADLSADIHAYSPTGALDEVYGERRLEIDEWARSFPAIPGQVGLLAFAGSDALGMDVVGSPTLYARLHDRLLRGYLLDALAVRTPGADSPAATRAQQFLDRVRAARRLPAPTVGRGTYTVLSRGVVGGELVDGDRLVHLSAFPDGHSDDDGDSGPPDESSDIRQAVTFEPPIAPPSQRRRGSAGE